MKGRLTAVDRATLRFWKGANVLGWSVAALGLSLFLRWGFESAASLFDRSLSDVFDWLGYWEYALAVIIPSSVVCGCLVGSLVGARVFLRPALVASVVSTVYGAVVWFAMASVDTPHRTSLRLTNVPQLALAVLVAVVVAEHMARARPSTAPLVGSIGQRSAANALSSRLPLPSELSRRTRYGEAACSSRSSVARSRFSLRTRRSK
jgi:hypothetical protein